MTRPSIQVLDPTAPPQSGRGSVVLIGNFDGVHRGHQAVIADGVARARAAKVPVYVLTFDPHPRAVLGAEPPALLTTLERRAELLARLDVEAIRVRRFDRTFASWSPERFVHELLVAQLAPRDVLVGEGFRFGQKRSGDLALLRRLGDELGFTVHAHAVEGDARGPYSSSRVREAIARGDIEGATHVLTRPHALSGVVVHGRKLGRTFGFPTANVGEIPELSPPDGVYAVLVDRLESQGARALAKGVMSIGLRPTIVGAQGRTHEVFLFDFDQDIYDARIRVHVVARLREERRFDGLDALKAQVEKDAADARALLAPLAPVSGAFG